MKGIDQTQVIWLDIADHDAELKYLIPRCLFSTGQKNKKHLTLILIADGTHSTFLCDSLVPYKTGKGKCYEKSPCCHISCYLKGNFVQRWK